MQNIFQKITNNINLDKQDVLTMLAVDIFSDSYYKILSCANTYSRKAFTNKGTIFAQIGIDSYPCSVNCAFCQLGSDNYNQGNNSLMSFNDIIEQVKTLVGQGANEIFLMSTADIDKNLFLKAGKTVRNIIPHGMKLVANTADFNLEYAHKLANAGFTGVYHICRLGEGVVTAATLSDRIITLDAIKSANLELYYCVEPIGPEHTNEQIAEEIYRAKDYEVNVMAVMRRINFENSPMLKHGEISAARLALICAASVLYVKPNRAMGVHEPEIISLISGANQVYAEIGSNPRDISQKTEGSRGFSVQKAQNMLLDAQWEV